MSNEKEKLQPGNAYRYVEPVEPRAIVTSHRQRAKEAKRKMWEIPGLNESDILSFRQKRARKNAVIKFILVGQVKMLLAEKAKYFEAQAAAAGNKVIERTFSKNLQLCEEAIAAVDNIEGCFRALLVKGQFNTIDRMIDEKKFARQALSADQITLLADYVTLISKKATEEMKQVVGLAEDLEAQAELEEADDRAYQQTLEEQRRAEMELRGIDPDALFDPEEIELNVPESEAKMRKDDPRDLPKA